MAEAFDKDIVWLERPPWDGWWLIELVGPWLKRNLPIGSKKRFDFNFPAADTTERCPLPKRHGGFARSGSVDGEPTRHWYVGQLPRKDLSANLSSWKSTSNCFYLIHISWFLCLGESAAPPSKKWKSLSQLCLSWKQIPGWAVGLAIRVYVLDFC